MPELKTAGIFVFIYILLLHGKKDRLLTTVGSGKENGFVLRDKKVNRLKLGNALRNNDLQHSIINNNNNVKCVLGVFILMIVTCEFQAFYPQICRKHRLTG